MLAPRAVGKSSLIGRAIRRLRVDGQLAAVVDLAQIVDRTQGDDATRWHYGIAYRICRELRLRFDLQAWWHDHPLLPHEQRLVEFFRDGVLANTEVPVTIFLDGAGRVANLPLANQLCAALHTIYTRRAAEPEYSRLNFVAVGAAVPTELCLDPNVSPFAGGSAVELGDFSLEQCYRLTSGLDLTAPAAREVIERVYAVTRGQPYLTQKLLRGVARRDGTAADVEAVLHELVLAPNVRRDEPYLAQMRAVLHDGSVRGRQAQAILARLAKGIEVIDDPHSAAQAALHLHGFVSSDENGMLRFRNRIVEQVFATEALAEPRKPRPGRLRRRLTAAAIVVALLGYWYANVLPQPYIDTLNLVSSDYALARQAHSRLSRLPGFGRRADRLLADVMVRRSRESGTLDEVRAADGVLRALPGGETVADELMADFWLRRADRAAQHGDRDAALIYALNAAHAGSGVGGQRARRLISDDYRALSATLHFEAPLLDYAVDWQRGQVTAVDATQTVHRRPLGATTAGPHRRNAARGAAPLRLTALRRVGVTRTLFADGAGSAAGVEMRLSIDHPRPADLLVRLRAPSGLAAEFELPPRPGGVEEFVTGSAGDGEALGPLADEPMTGQWELTLHDRLTGAAGALLGWSLAFPSAEREFDDVPLEAVPLPDPLETEQVRVVLAHDGRRAIALPSQADVSGAASIWDLVAGRRIGDVSLGDRVEFVDFVSGDALLVASATRARLWRVDAVSPIVDLDAPAGFTVPPITSRVGDLVAMADARGERVRVRIVDAGTGEIAAELETDPLVHWSFGPDGSRIAFVDGSRRGRVVAIGSGEPIIEFFHERPLDRVRLGAERIVAVDRSGEIHAWSIGRGGPTIAPTEAAYVGTTTDAASVTVSPDGSLVTFFEAGGNVTVARSDNGYRVATVGHGRGAPLGIDADHDGRLISAAGSRLRVWTTADVAGPATGFGSVSAMALGPRGAAAGYRDGTVTVGPAGALARNRLPRADYIGHRGIVTSLAFNATGDLVASGGSDGLVRLWDTQTNSPSRYLLRHPAGAVRSVAFSPDDRWLAAAAPRAARVFSLDAAEPVAEIEVDGSATTVAFSADSRLVAVGDTTGNIYLAALDGEAATSALRGRSAVTALHFAGEGGLLASGTRDGRLVLWDTIDARAVGRGATFGAPVRWIDADPAARRFRVLSGSWLIAVERDADRLTAMESTLLPPALRDHSALATADAGAVRVLANRGAGHLLLAEIEFVAADASAPGRDLGVTSWSSRLGMVLDPVTGRVEPMVR